MTHVQRVKLALTIEPAPEGNAGEVENVTDFLTSWDAKAVALRRALLEGAGQAAAHKGEFSKATLGLMDILKLFRRR